MKPDLAIIASEYLRREMEAVLPSDEYPGVRLIFIPTPCSRPDFHWENHSRWMPEDLSAFRQVYILGCPCLKVLGEKPASLHNVEEFFVEEPFSLILNRAFTGNLVQNGGYLLIPGQLADWKTYFSAGGFPRSTAQDFFQGAIAKLVLLDTFTDPDSKRNLREFSEWIGIPHETLPVGLDTIRDALKYLVLKQRLENEQSDYRHALSQARQQSAEFATALELTSDLTGVLTNEKIITRIFEIFQLLFSPEKMFFVSIEKGIPAYQRSIPEGLSLSPGITEFEGPYALIGDTGFRLKIPYQNEDLGVIEASGFGFPEYRDRYLNLALSIVKVCGLALSNARVYEKLTLIMGELSEEIGRRKILEEELRTINAELEKRVEERTASLAEINRELVKTIDEKEEARKQISEELRVKSVLLKEVQHRVYNNLQIVISLLGLQGQSAGSADLKNAFLESRNRIRIMAYVHEKVLASSDLGSIKLDSLFRFVADNQFMLQKVIPKKIQIHLEISDLSTDINTAIPVSLILNELLSNSIIHAFPGNLTGTITLTATEVNLPGLHIEYRDDGKGPDEGFSLDNPSTFGLILVHSLVQQLGGKISTNTSNGLSYVIDIPRRTSPEGKVRGTYNTI